MAKKIRLKTKKTFWLSYDLGLKGDYSALYSWLDNHKAKECGDSLAVFQYNAPGDHINRLKNDLGKNVSLRKSDRVYLIWIDNNDKKVKGKFIYGGRKPAPWEGFNSTMNTDSIDL